MAKKYKVGQLRPSQILFSYGVGAVADLLNFSVIIMGLEEWLDADNGLLLQEERLLADVQNHLGRQVQKLCPPPIDTEANDNPNPWENLIGIPVAPFPSWMVCPECNLLAPLQSQLFQIKTDRYRPEKTYYLHQNCNKANKPRPSIPVRFLVACEQGHLDDFPWHFFVHRGNTNCKGLLRLEERGVSGSTTEIFVKCDSCEVAPRPLSDAFGERGKQNMPQCRGRNPHLRTFDETCQRQMKTMLLGASNSWFPVTRSALSLPVGNASLEQIVADNWQSLERANTPEILEIIVSTLQTTGQLIKLNKYSYAEIWEVIRKKKEGIKPDEYQDLKTPEWLALSQPEKTPESDNFKLNPVDAPRGYESYFERIVLVEKLREVKALIGFTRIQSPNDLDDNQQSPQDYQVSLSREKPTWVPATEVKGEGIFLQFNEDKLQEWENLEAVKKYQIELKEAQKNWLNSRGLDPKKASLLGVRYLLIHSFTHALMCQLSIECGYNAASLKERIYSQSPSAENGPQGGVLIYTAAPDSEGTLGGLVNLGNPQTLGYHIASALETTKLCTSDPLCAEHKPNQGNISLHWAACHACLFAPETACERGNKFLDRAILVKTMNKSDIAYFG